MNKLKTCLNFDKHCYYEETMKNNEFILFGASKSGEQALEHLSTMGKKINYFCDNDSLKWGRDFHGIKIISPKELDMLNKNTSILITSAFHKEIRKQLEDMNFKNIYYIYGLGKDDGYYDSKKIEENENKINSLFEMLSDYKSKLVLENILRFRYTQDFSLLDKIFENNQYYPDDIIKLSFTETFIDAGTYNGDTVVDFVNRVNNQYKKIYAFEPDNENYRVMMEKLKENKIENIQIFKKGLSNKKGTVNFIQGCGGASKVDNEGNQFIETIDIDSLLIDGNIYMKMDIEGEELNALEGSKNTIINKKPKLAICVYHKSEDLWTIQLYIKKLVPQYKIYLRHHSTNTYETVCYATI